MFQKHLLSIFIFCVFSSSIFGANHDTISSKYDTNYIISYRDWFHVTLVGINQQSGISLIKAIDEKDLKFSTNNPYSFGVGIDYEWLTFEYSKSIKNIESSSKKKGNTKSTSLRLGYTGRKIRIDSYYTKSRGYYLKNIDDFIPDGYVDTTEYPRFDDLSNKTFALSFYYTFNYKKYSNMAALWQIDRQIKSAGSPVIGLLTLWEGLSSNQPFHFSDTLDIDEDFLKIKSADYKRIGIFGGYMHTFSIIKKFYLHGAITQGLFYSYGTINNYDGEQINKNTLGVSFNYRISVGYNSKRLYAGVLFVKDTFIGDAFASKTVFSSHDYLRILVGYRFYIKKRNWMKKVYM